LGGGATAFSERMRITNAGVIIGDGETSATPVNALIEATDGSGTNIAGASFTIQGGRGTGTAAGGSIILSTSNASATSGTTLNAATERMRITSDGDVAIGGTTSTGYSASYASLVVGSTSKIGLIKLRSGYNSGNGAEIFQLNTGITHFTTNSSVTWMVSDASGNVGIGTTTPTYPLDIYNTSMGLGNGSGMPTTINFDNGQYIVAYGSAGWFKSGNVITLDSNSFVGINTFSPEYQLDVAGAGRFTGNLLVTGSLNITGSQVITGSLRGNVSSLSISSNTASVNMSSNNFFTLALVNGANTHINPTNINPGQTVNIRVTQGSLGTGTVSFPSFVDQSSGSLYTGSAVANAIDIVTMITFDSTTVFMSSIRNMI